MKYTDSKDVHAFFEQVASHQETMRLAHYPREWCYELTLFELALRSANLVDVLPNGRHRVLEGQEHVVPPEVLVPVLAGFFAD